MSFSHCGALKVIILLLEKLGQNPPRSLRLFLRGIGLFAVGLLFITTGYFYHHLWQIIGLVIVFCACMLSAWGYLGIFSHRWLTIIYTNQQRSKKRYNGEHNATR